LDDVTAIFARDQAQSDAEENRKMAFITWRRSWDPLRELQQEVDRIFDSLSPLHAWRATRQYPAVNLFELDDEYLLTADVPGVAKEDLELTITDQTLTLKGSRQAPADVPPESYRRQERRFGAWSRSIVLPERVNNRGVVAEFSAGVLRVHMPKAEEARARRIPVAADEQS
jgi:HSP20 family protein